MSLPCFQSGILVALITVAAIPGALAAQEKVALAWRFAEGRSFFVGRTVEVHHTFEVMGMSVISTQAQTLWTQWTPRKLQNGTWAVAVQVIGFQTDSEIGGNRIAYDSRKNANPANLVWLNALVGAEVMLTIQPYYKVTQIDGVAGLIKRVAGGNKDREELLRGGSFSEVELKQQFQEILQGLPGVKQTIGVRESWTRQGLRPWSSVGQLDTTWKYTYRGVQDKRDKVTFTVSQKAIPRKGIGEAAALKLKAVKTTKSEGGGTVFFDRVLGRIVSVDEELSWEGDATLENGGMEIEVTLKNRQRTTIRVTETNPLK